LSAKSSTLLRAPTSPPSSLVDRFNPGTRGGADVAWAGPEAVNVRFDNELSRRQWYVTSVPLVSA
jgi:hypothetical protein